MTINRKGYLYFPAQNVVTGRVGESKNERSRTKFEHSEPFSLRPVWTEKPEIFIESLEMTKIACRSKSGQEVIYMYYE